LGDVLLSAVDDQFLDQLGSSVRFSAPLDKEIGFVSKHDLLPIISGPVLVFFGPLQSSFHHFSCKKLLFLLEFLQFFPLYKFVLHC
jgi:hypothetical protein